VPGASNVFAKKSTVTDEKQIKKMAIGFVGLPYKDDYGMTRVGGYIDNVSSKELTTVKIEMRMIDDKGNKRELVKYEIIDVPAKSRKTFDANAGALGGTRKAEIKIVAVEAVN